MSLRERECNGIVPIVFVVAIPKTPRAVSAVQSTVLTPSFLGFYSIWRLRHQL